MVSSDPFPEHPALEQLDSEHLGSGHGASDRGATAEHSGLSDLVALKEQLLAQLQAQDLGERLRAINQARPLPPEQALEVLWRGCEDANARVRYAAVSQLGTLTLPDPGLPLPLLLRLLKQDPEFDVRAAAAAALGDLKQAQVLPDLLEAYQAEPEWLAQFSIIAALGELGNLDAFEILAQALRGGNELIRTAAAAALGDLADPRAIPVLESRLTDPDWQLRYRITLALARIGGEATRPGLTQLASDPVEQVATQAQQALTTLGSP